MKLKKYKCDRCGKVFDELQELVGNSARCTEQIWDICDSCLAEFHKWMDKR